MSQSMRLELEVRPALNLGLNFELEYVPDFQLIRYLEDNALPLKARTKEGFIGTVNKWVSLFKTNRALILNEERVRRLFSKVYCALLFFGPELGLAGELAQTKERFQRDMAEDPFNMREDNIPNALMLYHQQPDQQKVCYDLDNRGLSEEGQLLALLQEPDRLTGSPVRAGRFMPELEEIGLFLTERDNRLEEEIVKRTTATHYRKTPMHSPYTLETQLNYLVHVLINPRMIGAILINPTPKQAEERYRRISESNGSFIIPLPKLKK
jgi:hypothetical protein